MSVVTSSSPSNQKLFKFNNHDTPHERMMKSIRVMASHSEVLYHTIKPEPEKLGYIAAAGIGAKSEKIRRAMIDSTAAIKAAGAESGGKLTSENSREAFELIDSKKWLMLDSLHRLSVVYHDRFIQLGLGLPKAVKLSLVWIREATKNFGDAVKAVAPDDELRPSVEQLIQDIMEAVDKALAVFSNVSTK